MGIRSSRGYFLAFFFLGLAFAVALGADLGAFSFLAAFLGVFFSSEAVPNALSQFDQNSGVVPVRTIGPLMMLPVGKPSVRNSGFRALIT